MADKIVYTLEVDDKNFTAVVRNANGEVVQLDKLIKKTGDDGSKSFQGMTATMRDVTVAVNGAVQALRLVGNALGGLVNASEEARANENQLNLALKNIGVTGTETAESIKQMATSMQAAGIAEGDAVVKTAALGLQMGITADNIDGATKAAYGLAKAYNTDADTAIKLISSGLQGNYEQLGRLNPAIRNAGTEAEKAAMFQKMLADGFNFAKSEGEQFSGTIKKIKNDFGDIQEELGNTIIGLGGVAKYIDLTASFEYLKAGLASIVNAFVVATDSFTAPFVIMWEYSKVVFAGLKQAFAELISGNFSAALDAMKNIAVEGTNIVKREYQEQQDLQKQFSDIWEQAGKNITAKKNEQALKDLEALKLQKQKESEEEQAAAAKKLEAQKKLNDEIFVENQELSRNEAEEQKKRVDEYNALQISKRDTAIKASEDVMQAEMDAYTEQYENQKTHNDAMTQLNNDYAVTILGGLELIQYQNQAAYDADIQAYRDLLEQKKVSNDEYVEYITKRTGKLNDDQTKAAMQAGKQGLKQMETDLKAASALGKDFAKVAKVISIANTTISSIEASIQAYKAMAGIPVIGPALGIAASAAALLAGAGAVAKITSTSTGFRDGGHTGYGNRDDVAGVVHNEEFVNTAETVDRVGIPALEALEDGRATIVPIASVSKPEAFTGSANTEYIARSVQALSMNITNEAGNGSVETVIINNSDLVTVTKKIEQTKNKYKSVGNNKLITEY